MNTHAYLALCALHPFAVEVFAAPKVTDIGVDGLSKRDECRCAFPQNAGLVAITPNAGNAGWAMSPDQHCSCGTYCPYACPSGFLPSQWNPDPSAARMDGGYHCGDSGSLELPRSGGPLCFDARGEVSTRWEGSASSFLCETVFPGNEAMLIPTQVKPGSSVQLAIPDERAFHLTNQADPAGAHYYANAPGYSVEEACAWGSADNPRGNWAPYTLGAVHNAANMIYVTIGWNPTYLEPTSPFRDTTPSFGIRMECKGAGCTNTDCGIDPKTHGVNQMSGATTLAKDYSTGPGQTSCTANVPRGVKVEITFFQA